MNQASDNGIYDLWFDLSQVSREEAEAVRNTLVLGYDRTDSPDGTRLLSIQPWGGDCMLYDISGEHPVALGQVSCSSGMPGGAVHSDPLWSPDGSRVAVTSTGRTIDAGMSFSFPIGPLPPELTHQKEGGLSGLTFACPEPGVPDGRCRRLSPVRSPGLVRGRPVPPVFLGLGGHGGTAP